MTIVVEQGGSGSELGRLAAAILQYYFVDKYTPVEEEAAETPMAEPQETPPQDTEIEQE